MKEQRRLAAIMFTDIVGCSALMSKDEKAALQILNRNRALQRSALHCPAQENGTRKMAMAYVSGAG